MATAPRSHGADRGAPPVSNGPTPGTPRSRRLWLAAELVATFALGVWLMTFLHLSPDGRSQEELGAAGNDSYYHVKMAALMPELGLVREFPWLQFVWFTQYDDEFVSHHYGFHVLLLPFVHGAKALGYDYLSGGRWAISFFFGLVLMLVVALLIESGVRWRWLWLILFLLLPSDFFWRHSTIRAIAPSLVFMLLLLVAMFRRRPVLAAILVAAYGHLYLGAVVYSPLLVVSYVAACAVGSAEDRREGLRMALWTACGWFVGLRTYPYFGGALEFLRMQVFGTGLSPDIPVGSEWGSYGSVWEFAAGMCGPVLAVWAACATARLRWGPRLDVRELSLTLMNFGFLLLTLKAKRFIEYWPVFAMLNASFLVAPPLGALADRLRARLDALSPVAARLWAWSIAALLSMTAIVLLLPVTLSSLRSRLLSDYAPAPQLVAHLPWWSGLAAMLTTIALFRFFSERRGRPDADISLAIARTLSIAAGGAAILGASLVIAGPRMVALQRSVRPSYDLPAVRNTMEYLASVSDAGDIVFTDDWDVFPVYFYFNHHNRFIVGLDPKFTHARDPELWERFVRVSRGEVPRSVEVTTIDGGLPGPRRIDVRLTDIRDHFRARWVVVDSDHKALARRLADTPQFAELLYPKTDYKACADAPYLIFRVRDGDAPTPVRPTEPKPGRPLYLSDLDPVSVIQGWGELTPDRSVEGEPLHVGRRFCDRGLGTHTPLELTYELPAGCAAFEAVVGVHAGLGSRGSAVAVVEVDGREVFRSDILIGGGGEASIRADVSGARRLTLRAEPTSDGNRFDHVDWCDARLIAAGATSTGTEENQP